MNKEALLDKLSEFLMVEQCGWQLYRVVAGRTADPELRAQYLAFGEETERHRTILIEVIQALGGDPDYISPTARMARTKSESLLASALVAGPLSEPEREANDLENVMLAETKDRADWELLGRLSAELPKGKVRTTLERATSEVGPQEDEHLAWAQEQLAAMSVEAVMGDVGEERPLERRVLTPDIPIKQVHAAPISKRSLLPAAKVASTEAPPVTRTTPENTRPNRVR